MFHESGNGVIVARSRIDPSREPFVSVSYSLELPTTRVDDPGEFVSGDA
jgi:hypothetical protein